MGSRFIMLECNRLRANLNYKNIDEEEDEFKNEWVNNVNSYGIVCNPGDVITCESSAINTVGASDSTIEFLGKPNKNGFIDNKAQIDFAYYLTDNGAYGVKLPLITTQTQMGFTKINAPPEEYQALEYNIVPNTPVLTKPYVVRNRSIGEPSFESTATIKYVENAAQLTGQYINSNIQPRANLVMRYELSKKSADIGTGYRIDGRYSCTGGGGTGMQIKVLDVETEGTNADIPTKIQLLEEGQDYTNFDEITIATAIDGLSNPTKQQKFTMISYLNKDFKSRTKIGPTNKRYYFTSLDYTGPYWAEYDGMPNTSTFNIDLNTENINNSAIVRNTEIEFECPNGLNTPDNIGSILTEQMHKGFRLRPTSEAKYIDYTQYFVNSQDMNNFSIIERPPLIETPAYTPMPAGGQGVVGKGEVDNNSKSFVGMRIRYYNQLCYLNPYKLLGLKQFNLWYYGMNNFDALNQINTGSNQVQNIGDFENQEIGNLGLFSALMMDLPKSTGDKSVIEYLKNGILMTNIYYREDTLKAIAEGFRQCEENFGNLNDKFTVPIPDANYGVNMDLGRYITSFCNGYPIQEAQGGGFSIGQRKRFKTPIERWSNTGGDPNTPIDPGIFVDEGSDPNDTFRNQCTGSIPHRAFIYDDKQRDNDGQQLSQLVVRSRFDESLYFDPEIDATSTDPKNRFKAYYDIISTQGNTDQNYYTNQDPITNHFINKYRELNGVEYNTNDLIAMAKKYNLAVIPIFPKDDPTDPFNPNQLNKPYIGFFSYYDLGAGDFNNNTFELGVGTYQIDARNCPYGIQLGYDPSPIRNPQMLFYNTNYANPELLQQTERTYNPVAFLGAVNPNIEFNPSLSRFEIKGLNTPMTIGNGLPTNNQFDLDATGNPEQQCYNCNVAGQIAGVKTSNFYNSSNGNTKAPIQYGQLNEFVRPSPNSLIDSYSGLAIQSINLFDKDGNAIKLQRNGFYGQEFNTINNLSDGAIAYPSDVLQNTLFGKMGFMIQQLLPAYGGLYADYENPIVFLTNQNKIGFDTFFNKFLSSPSPVITGAIINSAEYQPTSINQQDMPLYGLGTNMGLAGRPAVVQGALTAQDLPSKLDYPYLLIYSSIIQGGTDTQYYGGQDGKSKLPCVGYITRNYNQGDFFYSLEQTFNYTCTKSFTLTEIKTEIRLPDGTRPRLQPHNSVIYKITKPMAIPGPIAQNKVEDPGKRDRQGDGKSNKGP